MWDTQKTGKLPNSPTYRSPESDLDGKLTTACDVWALGCVYLEFVAWYFGGYRLVQRFGEQRLAPDTRMANMRTDTFFTIVEREGEKTADVKPAVLKVSLRSPYSRVITIYARITLWTYCGAALNLAVHTSPPLTYHR